MIAKVGRILVELGLCCLLLCLLFSVAGILFGDAAPGGAGPLWYFSYSAEMMYRSFTNSVAMGLSFELRPLGIIVWVLFLGLLAFSPKLPRIIRIPGFLALLTLILLTGFIPPM